MSEIPISSDPQVVDEGSQPVTELTGNQLADIVTGRVKGFSWSAAIIVLAALGSCSLKARLDNRSLDKIDAIVTRACSDTAVLEDNRRLQEKVYALQTQVAPFQPPQGFQR